MDPKSPVTKISGIGPRFKTLLEKLDISTIEDLLYHFPTRYEDFSKNTKICDLKPGNTVTITGVLDKVQNIFTRNGKRITKATLIDKTGKIDLIWFNMHYIKRSLKEGVEYRASGKVDSHNGKLTIITPEMEQKDNKAINTGRLVPIYPATTGISSKWIRNKTDIALKNTKLLELIPKKTLNKHKLLDYDTAIKEIHFPGVKTTAENARKRFAFEELLIEMLKVQLSKKDWQKKLISPKLRRDDLKINKLIQSLPFELTASQNNAVMEISEDLKKSHPMNRLLEGDVGTGKTVVAVIAAYQALINKQKVVYMAPTEILAKQHFNTFYKLLDGFGVNIVLKTSGSRVSLKEDFDIAIGTHALLFDAPEIENLGLVIIDEQQRFGVKQRTQLTQMRSGPETPHLLSMTATPIPRTLALTIYGDLAISVLKETPNKDKKITTWLVGEKKRDEAFEWIKKKKEQTFIVCPLIDESESSSLENVKSAKLEYEKLKNGVFKDLNVGLLHGKMKTKEKQEVVSTFRKKEIDVLVSTPVIEVGVDIPEATIIVIESAERYGLASLHQLRGRVGRGSKEAFCLVFSTNSNPHNIKRLKHLEKINNGLKLAEIDMKLRGQGDVYGTIQHGFKRFKIADLSDLEMLNSAKEEAEDLVDSLKAWPLLWERVTYSGGVSPN